MERERKGGDRVRTSQFPMPVAKALPRARICMGITSAM